MFVWKLYLLGGTNLFHSTGNQSINKIFDYIQAEVPVLVSDLPEMKKIVSDYKVGEVVFNRTPKTLAQQIEKILKKNFATALKTAKKDLIWEHQEQDLRAIFENIH